MEVLGTPKSKGESSSPDGSVAELGGDSSVAVETITADEDALDATE